MSDIKLILPCEGEIRLLEHEFQQGRWTLKKCTVTELTAPRTESNTALRSAEIVVTLKHTEANTYHTEAPGNRTRIQNSLDATSYTILVLKRRLYILNWKANHRAKENTMIVDAIVSYKAEVTRALWKALPSKRNRLANYQCFREWVKWGKQGEHITTDKATEEQNWVK